MGSCQVAPPQLGSKSVPLRQTIPDDAERLAHAVAEGVRRGGGCSGLPAPAPAVRRARLGPPRPARPGRLGHPGSARTPRPARLAPPRPASPRLGPASARLGHPGRLASPRPGPPRLASAPPRPGLPRRAGQSASRRRRGARCMSSASGTRAVSVGSGFARRTERRLRARSRCDQDARIGRSRVPGLRASRGPGVVRRLLMQRARRSIRALGRRLRASLGPGVVRRLLMQRARRGIGRSNAGRGLDRRASPPRPGDRVRPSPIRLWVSGRSERHEDGEHPEGAQLKLEDPARGPFTLGGPRVPARMPPERGRGQRCHLALCSQRPCTRSGVATGCTTGDELAVAVGLRAVRGRPGPAGAAGPMGVLVRRALP
jgi:hypothetical protein